MIYIDKNKYNVLNFTLKEKTTFPNPFYLMKLTSDDNLQSKVVRLGADSSLNLDRYNQFEIEETASEDLANGKITLTAGMTYDYQIYQTILSTGTTIGSWDTVVETGSLKVNGTGSTVNTTYTNTNTIYTYGE